MPRIHDELLNAIHRSNLSLPNTQGQLSGDYLTGEIDVDLADFKETPVQHFCELAESACIDHKVSFHFIGRLSDESRPPLWYIDFLDDGRCFVGFLYWFAIPYSERQFKIIFDAALRGVGVVDEAGLDGDGGGAMWSGRISVIDTELTVGQLLNCVDAASLQVTINERDGDLDSFGGAMRRLRAARPEDIIGMCEDATLEFKSFVDLASVEGKVELAQDVARFANSESTAVIIVGIRAEKRGGRDVADRITPLPRRFCDADRYQKVLDTRVYPPVRGLTIEQFAVGAESFLLAIIIPAQRLLDKPFLVHGQIVAGKNEGVFFSIVRRRGEDSIPITAREVHLLLSSGYRLLRHGDVPPT